MNQKPRHIKRTISNVFGSLGYLFCVLQWFWAVMLYFSVIQPLILFISSTNGKQAEHTPGPIFALPGPVQAIILISITVLMVAITVYALVKIPISIVKTSNKVVHKTTATVVPIVIKAQHKKDTKKVRAKVTSRVIIVVKLLLTIIPLAFTVGSGLLQKQPISYEIAIIIGGGLALMAIVSFTTQYLLAGAFRVKLSELW